MWKREHEIKFPVRWQTEKYLWCAVHHAANPSQRVGAREGSKKHWLSFKAAEQHCRVATAPMLTPSKANLRADSSSHHQIPCSVLLKQLETSSHHPHLSIQLPEKLCQVSNRQQQLMPTVICSNKQDTNSPWHRLQGSSLKVFWLDLGKASHLFFHYKSSSTLAEPGHSKFTSQCLKD